VKPQSSLDNTVNIAEKVNAELLAIARSHPPGRESQTIVRQSIKAYRALLSLFLRRITKMHDAHSSGIKICSMITDLIDCFVIHAFSLNSSCGNGETGFAVITLGGYGRHELNPFSDIDILCLIGDVTAGKCDNEISKMVQFLWDINLDLGHSTRTVKECIEAAENDTNFATALLEGRYLAGSETLVKNLFVHYNGWLEKISRKQMITEKIEERNQRLDFYHNTVQIQEPNVKECPGALRDIHTARWLLMLTGSGKSIQGFHTSGFLSEQDVSAFEVDLDFLLRIRNALHFLTGKKTDLLDHLMLPDIARNLGYSGEGVYPVEKLMHDYYMRAGRVRRLTDRVTLKILALINGDSVEHFKTTREGFRMSGKKISLSAGQKKSLTVYPELIVRLFAQAGSQDLTVSGETVSTFERFLEKFSGELSLLQPVREAFWNIINMKKGVARTLRLLHEYGVLTKLIPEFGEISWHYQYDFYHTYTTDEHSIRVVENLERMTLGTGVSPELREVMIDVTARGALFLSGLLHDIGKGRGKDHSRRSERMATLALKRLGFDDRTIELVQFLIREHLLMAHISQRRDIDESDTIDDFIEHVGSAGRLRMLTLLTFADFMALSEEALTEWKKALLWRLYTKALMLIEKGFEFKTAVQGKHGIASFVNALSSSIPENVLKNHLKQLPDQYMRMTRPAAVREHIQGIARMKRCGAWASFRHTGNRSLLTVIGRDHQKALSDICGTITSSDISISGARIFTRNDDIIIDTFFVTTGESQPHIPLELQRTFKQNIVRVFAGKLNVNDLISDYKERWKRRRKKVIFAPPRVKIYNDISTKYTIVDVFATDYIGLLYDITSVIASFNIDIHTARIGTDEDQVADAFYVQHRDGGKIVEEKMLDELKKSIIEKLNMVYMYDDKTKWEK